MKIIMELGRNLVLGRLPEIHKDYLAILMRVLELAFPCNQINDHRTFFQELMEADAEIHS